MEKKVCTKCNIEKCLSEYYFNKSRNRYDYKCKSCIKIKNDLREHRHFYLCNIHGEVWQTKQLKHCINCKKDYNFKKLINKITNNNINFGGFVDIITFPESEKSIVKCICKIHGFYFGIYKSIRDSKSSGCNKCRYLSVANKLTHKNLIEKKCYKCKKIKLVENFPKKKNKNGFTYCSPCLDCNKKYKNDYVKKSGGHSMFYKNRLEKFGKFYIKKNNNKKFKNKKTDIYFFNCCNCNKISVGYNKTKNKICKFCKHKSGTSNHRNRAKVYNVAYIKFDKWNEVYKRDNFICQYCGIVCDTNKINSNKKNYITIDCIIPMSKGGAYEPSNCVTACRSCNSKKSDKLYILPNKFPYKSKQLPLF